MAGDPVTITVSAARSPHSRLRPSEPGEDPRLGPRRQPVLLRDGGRRRGEPRRRKRRARWLAQGVAAPLSGAHLPLAVSSGARLREETASQHEAPEEDEAEPADDLRVCPSLAIAPRGLGRRQPGRAALTALFAEAADALAHLHDKGILHRDLKPANLMLTADGRRIVVMDLGLAQLRDRTADLTKTSTRTGWVPCGCTTGAASRNLLDVDERADVYGLGVRCTSSRPNRRCLTARPRSGSSSRSCRARSLQGASTHASAQPGRGAVEVSQPGPRPALRHGRGPT